jgi:hypothetical protein
MPKNHSFRAINTLPDESVYWFVSDLVVIVLVSSTDITCTVAELILEGPPFKYVTGKEVAQEQSFDELHVEFHPS